MRVFASILLLSLAAPAVGQSAPARQTMPSIDLAQPFGTRSPWRFTASQGADIPDPLGMGDDKAPGAIRLCVSNDGGRTCRPDLPAPDLWSHSPGAVSLSVGTKRFKTCSSLPKNLAQPNLAP